MVFVYTKNRVSCKGETNDFARNAPVDYPQ
jgi:hypothetical protein